jgi:tetratricopeptide (TPR) repeat protein
MKKLITLTCVLLTAAQAIHAQPKPALQRQNPFGTGLDTKQECTIIYASEGRTALAGNNEDYKSPFGTIWLLPAEKGKFGRVYFGWQAHGVHFPQGGMNDQGLFYDGASAENVIVPRDPSKPLYKGNLILKAMEECSTVEEVLKLFERYDVPLGNGQFLVGDRLGNSAIIEATGAIIRKKGKYQVVTNFFQSKANPENITDTRYRMATEMLERSEKLSVDLFRRILHAVHWEEYSGSMTVTLYSYICDLKNKEIYIYHFHDFEDVVKINLQDELKKGERSQSIVSLFPYETFAAKRYKAQRTVGLLYERALEKGVEGAIALFNEIKRGDYKNYQLSVVEGHLIALGYELLENNNTKEAIEVFNYAVSEYPRSANAYDSLGEACVKDGNRTQAIENYKKALELNPDLETAKQALKTLGEVEK